MNQILIRKCTKSTEIRFDLSLVRLFSRDGIGHAMSGGWVLSFNIAFPSKDFIFGLFCSF